MNGRTVGLVAVIACMTVCASARSRAQAVFDLSQESGRSVHAEGRAGHTVEAPPASLRQHFSWKRGTPLQTGDAPTTRSVAAAFGLSALAPGAGQIYNRDWVKAGVGISIEVALWTGYVLWKREGERKRDDYRIYAHEHYSPVKYAEWLNSYPGYDGAPISTDGVSEAVDFTAPESWSSAETQQVRQLIRRIQAAERQSTFAEPPHAAFSHQLPQFGEQQYYELIGKYHQYAAGWDDCTEGCGVQNPSERFFAYAELHGAANTLLRRASRATAFVVINHGLAAIDAAITAQLHNNSLDTEVSFRPGIDGSVRPYMNVQLSF